MDKKTIGKRVSNKDRERLKSMAEVPCVTKENHIESDRGKDKQREDRYKRETIATDDEH